MTGSEINIYQLDDGKTEIQVQVENETVWLTQKQMSLLFEKDSDTIGLHIKNIYVSGELDESNGLLKIISDYAYALDILDQYDYQTLTIEGTTNKTLFQLSYIEAKEQIKLVNVTVNG